MMAAYVLRLKTPIMKKPVQIIKIILLFMLIPFELSKGSKKRAYVRIKKLMVAANLL
jgi:hypothetical protein